MKSYKKAILALSIIAALPLMAATEDEIIYVTTFADEDGENSNACSLREAITTAARNKSYGGCTVGNTSSSVTDVIQLEAGEYLLDKPLTPGSMVNIYGKTPTSWDSRDVISGDYPEKLTLQTTIKGKDSFSLIDTTTGKATLTLNNIILTNGYAPKEDNSGQKGGRGGAIKAGGAVNLNRVIIQNSGAAEEGGAIYLSGIGSSLSLTNSVLQNNHAPQGAVLAMSCLDNLTFTERTLTLASSSFVNNGNTDAKSVLDFCGYPKIEFNTNTIARNIVDIEQGAVIKFTADSVTAQDQPVITIPSNQNARLSNSSSLSLLSNTIVDNTALSTLLYDNVGTKTLAYNILAYNNGFSCRHLLGGVGFSETAGISLSPNGLIKSVTQNGFCDIPYATLNDSSTIPLDAVPQSSIMTYTEASQRTAFMPMYFLINAKDNPLVDIDLALGKGCSSTDQRGITRLIDETMLLDQENTNGCDIGATELVKLATVDIKNTTNTSLVTMLSNYEAERDFFKELVENPDTEQEYLKYYQVRQEEFDKKILAFKASKRYRQVYFDVFANSLPYENDGNIKHFYEQNAYTISNVEVLGRGPDILTTNKSENLDLLEPDENLKCEWDPNLQLLLMYRTDGNTTQLADFGYCKYTISLTDNPSVKSTGVAQATFTNIAPVVKAHSYTMKWGTDQRVKLDLLNTDYYNDDGDGDSSSTYFPVGKKSTCNVFVNSGWSSVCKEDSASIPAPIKLGEIDSNLTFEAQYEAPCPDETRTMCYGGDIYVMPKNNFNKFNYSFNYQVFDADGTLSNTVKVDLINTATTSDDTRKGSSGGSMGVISLLALTGLALLRRRKI